VLFALTTGQVQLLPEIGTEQPTARQNAHTSYFLARGISLREFPVAKGFRTLTVISKWLAGFRGVEQRREEWRSLVTGHISDRLNEPQRSNVRASNVWTI
jgi:hypothetical protein